MKEDPWGLGSLRDSQLRSGTSLWRMSAAVAITLLKREELQEVKMFAIESLRFGGIVDNIIEAKILWQRNFYLILLMGLLDPDKDRGAQVFVLALLNGWSWSWSWSWN